MEITLIQSLGSYLIPGRAADVTKPVFRREHCRPLSLQTSAPGREGVLRHQTVGDDDILLEGTVPVERLSSASGDCTVRLYVLPGESAARTEDHRADLARMHCPLTGEVVEVVICEIRLRFKDGETNERATGHLILPS
jgi:hypothetical protein